MIFIRGKMNARAIRRYIIFRRGWLIGFSLLSFESIAGFIRFKVALDRDSSVSDCSVFFLAPANPTLHRIRMEAITSCYFIWKSYKLAFRAYCLWNNFVEWATYSFVRFVRQKIMTNGIGQWFFSGSSRMSCKFSLTFISSVKSLVSTSFHIRLNRLLAHIQWVYKLNNINWLTMAIERKCKRINFRHYSSQSDSIEIFLSK